MRAATRESKFVGSAELPGYFRKPYGPGWALLGDAGYHKNPITAMGINDAFRDAELVAGALDDAFAGRRAVRGGDERVPADPRPTRRCPIYEFTDDFAQLQPPPPEMQQLFGAMHGNQEAMDGFVSVQAATLAGAGVLRAREHRADHGRGAGRLGAAHPATGRRGRGLASAAPS